MDQDTVRLLLAVARDVEDHGLSPVALDALVEGGVTLLVEWHPCVPDAWRATVLLGGLPAPLAVDGDAAIAAARALRGAVIHGVDGDRVRLRPLPSARGPGRAGGRGRRQG